MKTLKKIGQCKRTIYLVIPFVSMKNQWAEFIVRRVVTFWVGQAMKLRHNNEVKHTNLIWQPGELEKEENTARVLLCLFRQISLVIGLYDM